MGSAARAPPLFAPGPLPRRAPPAPGALAGPSLCSFVAPGPFEGRPAVPPDALAELALCTVAARDYGDLRVKLFLAHTPAGRSAFDLVSQEVRDMVRLVPAEADADWALRAVPARVAA